MNEHRINIVEIPMKKEHPDADALSIVVIDGTTMVINDSWSVGDKAVLIPADFFVPDTEPFQFLKKSSSTLKPKHRRIKPMKLRGVWSEGLMLPAAELGVDHLPVGTDVMELLGIERYDFENVNHNPKIGEVQDVLTEEPPGITINKYKLHNYKQYKNMLVKGEQVRITEKIHGSNFRAVNVNGKVYLGTRNMWVDPDDSPSPQAKFLRSGFGNDVRCWLVDNPGKVLFGEVFGWVASLRYGKKQGEIHFRAFDVWNQAEGQWELPPEELSVPVLYEGPFSQEIADQYVDGDTHIEGAEHFREGVVIEPLPPRRDPHIGRCKFKYVSNVYLASGK